MSENLEDLLEGVDEESQGDYDLGDDEEEALLDDNFENEITTRNHRSSSTSKNTGGHELEYETEPDFVLELDDGTELHDEEDSEILINNSSSLNIEEEQERSRKTEKFTNERVIPTSIVSPHSKLTVQSATGTSFTAHKQYQNYNQFRGVGRGPGRGRYQNDHNRRTQFQQKKNVLINPHFKGNVQIRNNVSLAWDNNHPNHGNNLTNSKKPYMYIEPWVQNQQPVVNNFLHMRQQESFPILGASYGNASYQQLPPLQMNSKPPVHQRLGINSNFCNQPFLQMTQHQPFQQIQQNPVPNHVYDQFNSFQNPQYNNNQQQAYQNKMPTYEPPPPPPPLLNIHTNYPIHNNYCNSYEPPLPPPQVFTQTPNNNNYNQNNIYPQTIPVQNFDTRLVIPTVTFQTNHEQYQMPRKFNQGSPGKRKFDSVKGDLKKKKRSQLFANLHEVQTVDTLPEPVPEVPEDEEMKAYRLKIEQQKLIREKILRQKEERRKQAAKNIQANEDYQTLVTPKELIKKINPEVATKKTLANVNQNIVAIKTVDVKRVINRVVINKNCCDDAAAESSELLSKDHLNSFLSNRKIFAKDQSLADTSVVVVNNLASGTSAAKLRKLCQGVGDVQTLQMSSQERQATIQFKSVASAHAFYKKYQRFMLDLSMIQVTLKPLS